MTEHTSENAQHETADVTVVVVTHNSSRHLEALGRALLAGTKVPARLLVVDNASVDDTVERARAAGFDVLETGSNRGFGAGCNAGMHEADGEFVLFCNPDVVPRPNSLECLLNTLSTTPTIAIAGATFGGRLQGRKFARITGHIVGFLPQSLNSRPPLLRYDSRLEIDPRQDHVVVDYAVGAFILCRVAALRAVGGFDERFFLYFEEADLARRLGKLGWLTVLVPSARVAHEHNASSEGLDGPTMTPFRIHSAYLFYKKYHSRIYAEFARLVLAAGVTLDRTYRSLARRPQVYGAGTAMAPFRSITSIRRIHERGRSR